MQRQRYSHLIAIAAAAALSFTLIACGDSSADKGAEAADGVEAPRIPGEESESGGLMNLVRLSDDEPVEKVLPAGSRIEVRTTTSLSTKQTQPGDTFIAHLTQPLVVDGETVAPQGARAVGKVVLVERSGRVEGRARLGVELIEIETTAGDRVDVQTGAYVVRAKKTHTKDAQKIGIGAGVGAAIGAIAGGGDGAAKGAGVGAGAGTGAVLATRGDPAVIGSESVIWFELSNAVSIKL